jgi:hypothetical protein
MNGPASGLTTLPLGVVALAFFADIDVGQRYFQIYSSDTAATLKNLHISGLIPFQTVAPGAWRAAIPLAMEKAGISDALFDVFGYLGFGAVV